VRRSAAWALGQLEARSAVDVLIAVLRQDADARVREMAAWALGSIETQTAAPGLIGALRRDSSDAVRETAAWALGNVGDRTAVDILGDAVRSDKSARVRGTAAWALGQLDPKDAPRGLIEGLTDQDDEVRLKSAWALGQIGDSSAVIAIRGALRTEKSDRARKAQIRALLQIEIARADPWRIPCNDPESSFERCVGKAACKRKWNRAAALQPTQCFSLLGQLAPQPRQECLHFKRRTGARSKQIR